MRSGDRFELPLTSLCPNPFNKRQMKGIPELAATIQEVGLLQDIAHIRADVWLKQYPETRDKITADNVILFGEHRWRAFQLLERPTIPSVLRDDKVQEARLITLIENLRRAQLSVMEEAEHYQALREEGLSYEQIAEKVGETAEGSISKGTVWKRVQLLKLDPAVLEQLHKGKLAISSAEKLLTFTDPADQRDALALIQDGVLAAAAQAQILARKKEPKEQAGGLPAQPSAAAVSSGNADAPAQPSGSAASTATKGELAVSNENDASGQAAATGSPAAVSNGNGNPVPPRQRQKNDDSKPTADQYEQDRATAAADRDAACQHLVETVDLTKPETHEMLIRVLTAAALAPPQQGPAQQRALAWLRRVGRQQLEESRAGAYYSAVLESGDEDLLRLAAFASALATCELRTSSRRQSWGPIESGHVRFLQHYAKYVPETEWEKKEMGLLTTGGSR
ncbi:ParB/RepB/Spo0J family partition protein [Streptomyces capitiformicae]|uniref:ParB/RepB/Spo0J family partition protein n=1 Tax=Streptomyces capitiformicae TaxID=2014920 RepID=UPI001E48A5B3|nr:ParB/RepB/Spo0J family partition protein [Streptomyces capitiformicae]